MTDIVERLHFDAARCEATFSKGVATNIEEAADEIERLRAAQQRYKKYKRPCSCCGSDDHVRLECPFLKL